MEKITLKYFSFNHRFWISTGEFVALGLMVFLEIFIFFLKRDAFFIITAITIPFYIFLTIRNYFRAKKYISQIEMDDKAFYISIAEHNKILNPIIIPIQDLKIDILGSFSGKRNSYQLEFRRKSLVKKFEYELIHKQHEIGDWSMEKQKYVFKIIREKQGKLSGTVSITKSIYS